MSTARHAISLLLASASTLGFARAQCPGDPGHVLTTDSLFSIGEMLAIEATAPAGSQGFLLMSPNPGPMSTFFGELCIGSGFGVALQFTGPASRSGSSFATCPAIPPTSASKPTWPSSPSR